MAGTSGKSGKDRLEEGAQNVGHRAQETASSLGHRAQEAGSQMAHRASEAATAATHRADEALSNVGQGISSLASQMRQNAPQGGMLGQASSAVAGRLEQGGRYLQEHGVGDMADDLSTVIRSYPMAALGVGFGLGFLLGMAFSRRS
jgi:ElaB/YqjD/DUF883 family membrane-anchored ribosome-binding protein